MKLHPLVNLPQPQLITRTKVIMYCLGEESCNVIYIYNEKFGEENIRTADFIYLKTWIDKFNTCYTCSKNIYKTDPLPSNEKNCTQRMSTQKTKEIAV